MDGRTSGWVPPSAKRLTVQVLSPVCSGCEASLLRLKPPPWSGIRGVWAVDGRGVARCPASGVNQAVAQQCLMLLQTSFKGPVHTCHPYTHVTLCTSHTYFLYRYAGVLCGTGCRAVSCDGGRLRRSLPARLHSGDQHAASHQAPGPGQQAVRVCLCLQFGVRS